MPVSDKILAEALSWIPPEPVPRSLALPQRAGRADALIGLRRVGKTYRMFQALHELLGAGVERERICYLNLEDERLGQVQVGDLTTLFELWEARVPDLHQAGGHLFLDEVQRVEGWERFVRRLLETTSVKVTVTGSSANLLAGELATTLRGRAHRLEVFPFSFAEWLRRSGVTPRLEETTVAEMLAPLFKRYLFEGGLPDVFGEDDATLRRGWLQDHARVVVLRDVAERHSITNLQPLEELAREFLVTTARKFSLNRFYQKLRSLGYKVGRDSLAAWYAHLQEAYLIGAFGVASRSPQVRRVNPDKVYLIDTGLAAAHAPLGATDTGHLLETAVFWELRRRGYTCAWVNTRRGYEVDFYADHPDGYSYLIQVCADFTAEQTQERELRALYAGLEEQHLRRGLVVTLDHEEEFEVGDQHVTILPAWKWFLQDQTKA